MTEPRPEDGRDVLPGTADPTLRVSRPPIPGRAVRAEMAAGTLATPPVQHGDPTVTLASAAATRTARWSSAHPLPSR